MFTELMTQDISGHACARDAGRLRRSVQRLDSDGSRQIPNLRRVTEKKSASGISCLAIGTQTASRPNRLRKLRPVSAQLTMRSAILFTGMPASIAPAQCCLSAARTYVIRACCVDIDCSTREVGPDESRLCEADSNAKGRRLELK
jgi:hypothetical protein